MSLSGRSRRNKGLRAEREVALRFRELGHELRGLEGSGDHLCFPIQGGPALHLEVKRQERIQIDLWSSQAEAEAPLHALPVVVYRRSHEPWRVCLRLDDFLALLATPFDEQ